MILPRLPPFILEPPLPPPPFPFSPPCEREMHNSVRATGTAVTCTEILWLFRTSNKRFLPWGFVHPPPQTSLILVSNQFLVGGHKTLPDLILCLSVLDF